MREITVATVQMAPKLPEVGVNLERKGKRVEDECRDQMVDSIVFPELITTGHECGVRFAYMAEQVPRNIVDRMAEWVASLGVYVALGLARWHAASLCRCGGRLRLCQLGAATRDALARLCAHARHGELPVGGARRTPDAAPTVT